MLALYAIVVQRRDRRVDRAEAAESEARANRAQATAEEATAAAQRAAGATERMAQTMEAQALAIAPAAPSPQAAWTLRHLSGDSFILENVGDAEAYDVHVDTGDLGGVGLSGETSLDLDVLRSGDSIRFLAARDFGTRDDTVTLTWATAVGAAPRLSWSRPLPPPRS